METRSWFSFPLFDTSGWKSPTQHVHTYPSFWSHFLLYMTLSCIPTPEHHPWFVCLPLTINSLMPLSQVDTEYLLSFPALSKLTTLHRPPRPQSAFNLSTRIYFNYGPEPGHQHLVLPSCKPLVAGASAPDPALPYFYSADCTLCRRWNTRASDSEAREIVELTRHFPGLKRVLIQRVLCLDGVSVNDDPQVYAPETELDTEARERTDCTEEWEERRDVAIWTVRWDSPCPSHEHEEGEGQEIKVSQTAAETKFWSNTQSTSSTSDIGQFCFDWDL